MKVIEVEKVKILFKLLQFAMPEPAKEQMNKDIDYILGCQSFEVFEARESEDKAYDKGYDQAEENEHDKINKCLARLEALGDEANWNFDGQDVEGYRVTEAISECIKIVKEVFEVKKGTRNDNTGLQGNRILPGCSDYD